MNDEEVYSFDATSGDSETKSSKKGPTVLDKLREVVEKEVRRPSIEIDIPDRPGVSVTFSPNINQEEMSRWRKQAGEGRKDGLNFLKLSTIILGQTCEHISIEGELVADEDGNYLTFASAQILEMVDEEVPVPNGIKRFWGSDAHLQATALKILEYAGWGDEAEAQESPLSL